MIVVEHDEDRRQFAFLGAAPGEPGSGRVRYAAAMHFFQRGMLSRRALECFRVLAKEDGEDPQAALARLGLADEIADGTAAAAAIGALVTQIDAYLARLDGEGVAEVREGIARFRDNPPRPRLAPPHPVVTAQLEAALSAMAEDEPVLAAAIAAAAPFLAWIAYDGYAPEAIGPGFAEGHAYASVIGEASAIAGTDFDLGLFVIAPNVFYRDHCHRAPELYAPLTGPHGWRFAPGAPLQLRPAHQPVWNPPFQPHATKVGAVPFLCLFGWTRDVAEAATVIPADDWAALEAMRLP